MNTSGFLGLAFPSILAVSFCAAGADRFVSPTGNHVAPFTDRVGAATNIQEAIDVSAEGDTIWVTNGIYATVGKVMSGDLTNRVALDKALTVPSVNGPLVTRILGNGATNGANAVRCAWLTNGAMPAGFTFEAGATRPSRGAIASGGGAWVRQLQCNLGAMHHSLEQRRHKRRRCVPGHHSQFPAGWKRCYLANLSSCTVVSNTGTAVVQANLTNSIIYYNGSGGSQNYSSSRLLYDFIGFEFRERHAS